MGVGIKIYVRFKKEEINMKFELSVEEVNVALAGLGELPAKTSFGVISKIKTQAEEQLQAQERQKEAEQQLLLEKEGTNNGTNS